MQPTLPNRTEGERLHSKKGFAFLFSEGKYFGCGCLGVRYGTLPLTESVDWPLEMAVSVPKRKFKRANRRNLLKRRIKEAYRIHRLPLLSHVKEQNQRLIVLFIYKPYEVLPYEKIEQDMQRALTKLLNQC